MPPENNFTLPETNSIEQNAALWAKHQQDFIKPGHGLFFDFKATPELEQPAIDCLVNTYGWVLEKPFFIRKPKDLPNQHD